jgi:muramoyltetrapeptide carboxypeptidase
MIPDNRDSIKKGDTIGLIAPSSPLSPGLLEASIAYFEKEGFKIKIGKNIQKAELFSAGTDEQRADDIMNFFKDSDVSAIITTNGGTCSIRTLPLLDYDVISKNPKPIIGYSDATALQLGVYFKTGGISFTGFNCSDIKEGAIDCRILSTLTHCLNEESYSIHGGATINHGSVTAPLIGGNLMCLLNLMGTPYQPDFSNKILLIEDVGIEPYIVEGMFSQLYVAGILNNVSGVVIGTFTECTARHFSAQAGTTEDIIHFWCKRINVPCIRNFSYGHIESRYVVPIGQMATLDATNCKLDIHFDK